MFIEIFDFSAVNTFNLDKAKILSSGQGLNASALC